MYYDRYKRFKENNKCFILPFIPIGEFEDDKRIIFKLGSTRLDKVSNDYYGHPYYGWLIMAANPQFGGLEFLIPDREVIRIPFPLESALKEYDDKVTQHIELYGRQ